MKVEVTMLSRTFLSMVAFLATSDPAGASYCSEPNAPYCASRHGSFDDEDEFSRCKREMQRYRNEVEAYLECLRQESDETVSEYESVVSSFNRRARGN